MTAARLVQRFPSIVQMLEAGSIHLSALVTHGVSAAQRLGHRDRAGARSLDPFARKAAVREDVASDQAAASEARLHQPRRPTGGLGAGWRALFVRQRLGERCPARAHSNSTTVCRGREAEAANGRLLCRAHNRRAAERIFGKERVAKRIDMRVEEVLRSALLHHEALRAPGSVFRSDSR